MITRLIALVIALCCATAAGAADDGGARCKDAKAKAVGKKAAALLKAVGKNTKKSNPLKLAADISKAQSKFTKSFNKAESKGGCLTTGDVTAIEAKVDAFVNDATGSINPVCGDGIVAPSEQCDDGNLLDGDCCSSACVLATAGTECRASAGDCDPAETCNGVDGLCPGDVLDPAGTVCRPSAGVCDIEEACDGVSGACPSDAVEPSTTVCRPAVDQCDVAENCTGTGAACPANVLQSDGTPCDDGDACTDPDTCQAGICIGDLDTCGDGIIQGGACGEECDDSNTVSGDGCSSTCLDEPDIGLHKCVLDDTGVCQSGLDTGSECVTEADCSDICSGGIDAGEICFTSTDCTRVCTTGPLAGQPCTSNNNCRACLAGPDAGSPCAVLADCQRICVGGANNGLLCNAVSDCPGGTCPNQCPAAATVPCEPNWCPATPCSAPDSSISVVSSALSLDLFPQGSLDIDCGFVNGDSGESPCTCSIQDFVPLNFLGFVCITPFAGCPDGKVDCDGGTALDVTVNGNHNIGSCTGNADCATQCGTHCAGLGLTTFDSGCEGFCQGGTNADMACTSDAECPGGNCAGADPVPAGHLNLCNCNCIGQGGTPSSAGDMLCNVGASINLEGALPCDGTDVTIAIGSSCIPLTTADSSNVIVNANNGAGTLPAGGPALQTGAPFECNTLQSSVASGGAFVGGVGFFDSLIGDLAVQFNFVCD
jgi:cysteine-rich repeat protein